jgi:capsular polysaccharide biosynthesis protein
MTIFGLAVALAVSFLLPPRYRSETTIVIDYKGMDPVSGSTQPAQALPGYLATQIDIIQSHRVALRVVRKLKLADNPVAKQQWMEATAGKGNTEDWLSDLLLDKLDVVPTRDSSVIAVQYTSQDPQFAAIIADSFAKAYIETNLELRVAPARESIILATDQPRSCRALAVELLASMPGFAPIPYSPESAAKLARYVADLLTGRVKACRIEPQLLSKLGAQALVLLSASHNYSSAVGPVVRRSCPALDGHGRFVIRATR